LALQPRRLRIASAAVGCKRKRLLGGWSGCYSSFVIFTIELEAEADGRWLAEVPELPGTICYGADREDAVARVQALALRVIAERLEHREAPAEYLNVTFKAA
jgi:predicted RNase H-like HicB family nuclease